MKLRRINRKEYPELKKYTDHDIWKEIGPGGLFLTTKMTRLLNLKKSNLVLDLGCGKGETSIFLARHFGARVIAVDLWTSSNYLLSKFTDQGVPDILPLNLDASKPLPFPDNYFDAIFCMNSLSFFGGNKETLNQLCKHLKNGGLFCVGGETLSEEFSDKQLANPPDVYNFTEGVWEDDFLKLHSPPWWRILFSELDEMEVLRCEELKDGRILYEDQIQHFQSEGYLGLDKEQVFDLELRQIEFGRFNDPYMTIFTLLAKRK